MSKRQYHRHTKRLETIFTTGGVTRSGITSDVSEGGIFIRTRHALVPDSILSIELYLPDGSVSKLRGRVKRSVRTPIPTFKNGMGVELTEKDSNYINFIGAVKAEKNRDDSVEEQKSPEPDFTILACQNCGAKNKVRTILGSLTPKCGKCKQPLYQTKEEPAAPEHLIISCSNCNAKNKVAMEKLSFNPRCGKCGTTLRAEDIV